VQDKNNLKAEQLVPLVSIAFFSFKFVSSLKIQEKFSYIFQDVKRNYKYLVWQDNLCVLHCVSDFPLLEYI